VVPQLCRVYPNGVADVNHFHAAGGLGFVISELLGAGLLHDDVNTILGHGLGNYCQEPLVENDELKWQPVTGKSLDESILRPADKPFAAEGGMRLVAGNLGRAIVKVSAVDPEHHAVKAPARVFTQQQDFVDAFNNGELEQDFVAVLTCQGPRANGMPELHKLTPYLAVLQGRGFKVALLTDGRMSGASGKVLAAIQVTPEAVCGGLIAKVCDGDLIEIDAVQGTLSVTADGVEDRDSHVETAPQYGLGRELFGAFRERSGPAETGASLFTEIT